MVVCQDESSFCTFTLFFGVVSIFCLVMIDTILLKFNESPNIQIIFLARFLCITMILQYFIPFYSGILYFIKEFILLLSYCATAYYFIFQASHLLFESRFFRYLLNGSLIFTGIGLSGIILYFLAGLLADSNPMPCNSVTWVVMRVIGLALSILSLAISAWIQKKVNSIARHLDQHEMKDRVFYLWLFNSTLIYCNTVKLLISVVLYSLEISNCFKMIAAQDYLTEISFGIILATTDYSLIVCVIYMFFRTVREKNIQKIKNLSRILESPKDDTPFDCEVNSDTLRKRRESSDSAQDYMMYST